MCSVQLDDDHVGQAAYGRSDTTGSSQIDFTVFGQLAGFDDGYVYFAHEAIAQFLCHLRKVDVVVGNLTVVYGFAEVGVGGVGSTVADGFGARQDTVAGITCRGSGEDTDLERIALCMFFFCDGGQSMCNGFGSSCGGKSAQTNVVAMFDEACSFFC